MEEICCIEEIREIVLITTLKMDNLVDLVLNYAIVYFLVFC